MAYRGQRCHAKEHCAETRVELTDHLMAHGKKRFAMFMHIVVQLLQAGVDNIHGVVKRYNHEMWRKVLDPTVTRFTR